ncbi:NADP-dependent oxidoreductase [Mumia zhuanghuii]|uniref:Zinc-binding dehydrogenase n=2 Tax=Mumia TaxID=1546255 RepID=A0ABW1QI32_9ACTN|nr:MULTISPECIES: NADP-dependent oxidoreductase [Mumia]KAA1418222.1 NADP-dependent oxidoreductase [Mumia zhuanghuii]
MSLSSRAVLLARRPAGVPALTDFALGDLDVPDPGQDEVVVENHFLSVDPGQRGLMNGGSSYVTTYQVGEPVTGRAVGQVVASRDPRFPEGSHVFHRVGWRQHSLVPTSAVRAIDVTRAPESSYLGVMGHPGLTSWLGVTLVGDVQPGDVVLVTSAAGAVGAAAGQLALARGASRVIGSVGSAEKATYVTEKLGFTDAFVYKETSVADYLADQVPSGVDVVFDNVGGAQLDQAMAAMRPHGRLALCGSISTYNGEPYTLQNTGLLLSQRLRAEGFLVFDHEDKWDRFHAEMADHLTAGRVSVEETHYRGLDAVPEAFLSLFNGASTGKVLVDIRP